MRELDPKKRMRLQVQRRELLSNTRINRKKLILILVVAAVIVGGFFLVKKIFFSQITFSGAGKIGKKTMHELLVNVRNPKGSPQDLQNQYERGDIISISDGEKQWSLAEQEGFLIIKMDITDKQAEMLMQPEEKQTGKDTNGQPIMETLKLRQYEIDLSKVGIALNDEHGKVINNKVFGDDIVIKKG